MHSSPLMGCVATHGRFSTLTNATGVEQLERDRCCSILSSPWRDRASAAGVSAVSAARFESFAMTSGRSPLKLRCHPERSEGPFATPDQGSLATLGMTALSQLRQCEVSAGIRHNIAQFCQERNVGTPREGILAHRRGRAIRTRTPRAVVNLRAMPAKCQHRTHSRGALRRGQPWHRQCRVSVRMPALRRASGY